MESQPKDLKSELTALFNKYSCENVSGTPDFVLAEVALDAVRTFNEAVHKRAEFRGEVVDFSPEASLELLENVLRKPRRSSDQT